MPHLLQALTVNLPDSPSKLACPSHQCLDPPSGTHAYLALRYLSTGIRIICPSHLNVRFMISSPIGWL